MVVPFVFLIVLPAIASFLGLYQAWLTHVEEGYSADTASSLMMLPWVPLLLGISAFVLLGAIELRPAFEDGISLAIGLSVLGASVAAGLTGRIGLGELLGDHAPYRATGLNVPMILTGAAICAALVMIGLADLAISTMFSIGAAAGVGAAAAGGAHYWGERGLGVPREQILVIGVAAAIVGFLVAKAAGF